jgi:predicted ATP-grasp superfamily ATP-dependent carboligase
MHTFDFSDGFTETIEVTYEPRSVAGSGDTTLVVVSTVLFEICERLGRSPHLRVHVTAIPPLTSLEAQALRQQLEIYKVKPSQVTVAHDSTVVPQ